MSAQNLTEIFNNKIFRIPDYQRGYAWGEKQLIELWDDLEDINSFEGELRKHYTGTIYLEQTSPSEEEKWLPSVKFYNVVDGQQRLSTICILLFELLKISKNGFCEESKDDLLKRFILKSNTSGASKIYKFSYLSTDKNYNFLLNKIFDDRKVIFQNKSNNQYTKNLLFAKNFFFEKLKDLSNDERTLIFTKVSTALQFDIRYIEKDLDVQAVFETMNNRGKPLSTLEKLKNRLIYLTEKLKNSQEDKIRLRKKINEAWGKIYVSLAQNPDVILDEDIFLSAHLSLYRKPKDAVFSEKLAEEKVFQMFCNRAEKYDLEENGIKEEPVTFDKIDDYIIKLSEVAPIWYDIHNSNSKLIKKILVLNSSKELKILLMSIFIKIEDDELKNKLLINLEKIFFRNRVPGIWVMDERVTATWARDIYNDEESIEQIIAKSEKLIQTTIVTDNIVQGFKYLYTYERGPKGFHRWGNLKYFLFEYDEYLKVKFKEKNDKVTLDDFEETTIEHIIPQKHFENWQEEINKYSNEIDLEKTEQAVKILINTLGNLTILKNGKNSSLGNRGWIDKNERFKTGSYNEIDISLNPSWDQNNIYKRGIELLRFLEVKVDGLTLLDEEIDKILFSEDYLIEKIKSNSIIDIID